MARPSNGWGDQSDVVGLLVGIPVFIVTGVVADVAFGAGLMGWAYACSLFAFTTNLTAWRLRRRGADGDLFRAYAKLTPGVWLSTAAMLVGLVMLLVGAGAKGAAVAVPIAGGVLLTAGLATLGALKWRQYRTLNAALRERHGANPAP